MRGAADVSGDGKVTLNEAYQFAFHETLGGTEIESIHELAHPAAKLLAAHPGATAAALAGAAALTLLPAIRRRLSMGARWAFRFLREHAPFRFVVLAVGLGGLALVLDLDEAERLIVFEEQLELLAAMALAFAALCIPSAAGPTRRLRWNPLAYRASFQAVAASCIAIAAVAGILFGVE